MARQMQKKSAADHSRPGRRRTAEETCQVCRFITSSGFRIECIALKSAGDTDGASGLWSRIGQ